MSLLYRIFGIPRTEEEFIEKADKEKKILNVFYGLYQENTLIPGHFPFNYKIGIKLGMFELVLDDVKGSFRNYVHGLDNASRLILYKERAKNIASEIAERISTAKGNRVVKLNGNFYNLKENKKIK